MFEIYIKNGKFEMNAGYFQVAKGHDFLFVFAKTKRPAMCCVCDTASHKSTSYSKQKCLFNALKSIEDYRNTVSHYRGHSHNLADNDMVMKSTKAYERLRVSYISIYNIQFWKYMQGGW